jgi:hypothetical protein
MVKAKDGSGGAMNFIEPKQNFILPKNPRFAQN